MNTTIDLGLRVAHTAHDGNWSDAGEMVADAGELRWTVFACAVAEFHDIATQYDGELPTLRANGWTYRLASAVRSAEFAREMDAGGAAVDSAPALGSDWIAAANRLREGGAS